MAAILPLNPLMKKQQHTILHLAILFLISTETSHLITHAQLQPIGDDQTVDSMQLQTYIVHVVKPSGRKILHNADREQWHRSFLPNATLDTGEPRLVYSYSEAFSGFAAKLTPEELKVVQSMDGFMHAWPDERRRLMTTHTPEFLGLSQRGGAWYDTGYGKGIIVGVLDNGIFPAHSSCDGDGMPPPPPKWRGHCDLRACLCNNKLIGVSAFLGGRPLPADDGSDDGHGTHMASIVAGSFVDGAHVLGMANGTASGMAPRAHLAVYKVCTSVGCADSDILAGIDQAIQDGVDVLSISMGGSSRPFYEDSVAIGSFAAIRRRILTCAAAGNDGPRDSTVVNDAPWILTVGASSTDRRISVTVRLGNGLEFDGESAFQPSSFNSTLLPLIFPSYKDHGGQLGCKNDSFKGVNIKGKIVICETGYNITNIEKGEHVKMAGGVAMLLLNQLEQGSTTLVEAHVLPAAHLSYPHALNIISYLNSSTNSTPTAAIMFKGTRYVADASPAVTSFSSRGPSLANGGLLKPDIVGPGLSVLGGWPSNVEPSSVASSPSTFNFLSGTSVATSHLAGIAALLKNAHPHWLPAEIKSAIMTTADRLDRNEKPMADEYNGTASLFTVGAGHVNPTRASNPGLVYNLHSHSYIHYLCGLGYTDQQVMMITGTQHDQFRCSQNHDVSAEQLNYPSISLSLGSPSRKRIRRKVKNVGEENSVYLAQIEEPEDVRMEVYPSRLEFTRLYETRTYHVVFMTNSTTQRKGQVSEGHLSWVSRMNVVRSPISITFT